MRRGWLSDVWGGAVGFVRGLGDLGGVGYVICEMEHGTRNMINGTFEIGHGCTG